MSDPAIEPESGLSYKVLFERTMRVLLFTLEQLRDAVERKPNA